MFSYTTGGPFGLEDMVTTSGPGMTLIFLLVLPFFWCIPVSLVSAELTTVMPVEGGFYRWTRTAFGDFWGFLSGWWNWSASFLLGGAYAVLFTDYLVYYFPGLKTTWWEHYLVSVGLIDTVCRPTGIYAAFNQIPGTKEMLVQPDAPHDGAGLPRCQARMKAWRQALLKGQPLPPPAAD